MLDEFREVLQRKGLIIQEVRECTQGRSEWRNICSGGGGCQRTDGELPA